MTDRPVYRVLITDHASRQLARELRRSRSRWGRDNETRLRSEIRATLDAIARMPHQHRARPESFGVRIAWVRAVQIAYLADDDRAEVMIVGFVWRQSLENALKLPPDG